MWRGVKRGFGWLLVGLLALLCGAGAVAGVYAWRAFPSLDGSLQANGLTAAVGIKRDMADVTHIEAASERDAAFALGYVHAQERSWQLEFNRRVMHGRLSEFLGEPTLETDKLMRTLGILRSAHAQYVGLPAEVKDSLQAYADGINSFHANSSQALPPEFHILGIKPGIWTAQDSVGWSIMMALDLGGNWGTEIARASAAKALDTPQLWQLYPVYEGEKPKATVDVARFYRELGLYKSVGAGSTTAQMSNDATKLIATNSINTLANPVNIIKNPLDAARARLRVSLAQTMGRLVDDIGHGDAQATGLGSNNWLVAGSRSASGKPLLANDPHLGLSSPAIWYFAALKTPAGQVVGATLPGLPSVILGRNQHVAWGFTNVGPDVQDVYIERVDPANPQRYQTPTGWADFEVREETIAVKGKANVLINVRSTRHGPVLSDSLKSYDWVNTANFALALRWSALDADNTSVRAGFEAARAKSVPELFAAYAHYHSPMQNVVAADVEGRTGYKAVGKVPLRRADHDFAGLLPAPGWDAKYDWTGWLPYADTPFDNGQASNRRAPSFNGQSELAKPGWLATANQRIHDASFPAFMGQDWGNNYRQTRIEALLEATPLHTSASFALMQADITSLAAQRLMPHFQAAINASVAVPEPLKTAALSWNGVMAADSSVPLLFAHWMDQFTREVLPHRLGEARFAAQYGRRQFRAGIEQILETNDTFWCKVQCAVASANALNRAVAEMSLRHGTDPSQWLWGVQHRAVSRHNPLGNVAPLAKLFDVAVPTGGDANTVNVGQYNFTDKTAPFANRHAASLRAIYDLADLERSQFIYQTGQSGLVFSSRYRDMSAPWAAGQYRPLQLRPSAWAHELTLQPGK